MDKITISGSGLVGSLQSILLAQKGYSVDVYERRPDMRTTWIPAGRSINLALSERGWRALEKAGLAEDVKKFAIPMYKRTMHDTSGNLTYQPYGKENEAIWSVSRGELNKLLMTVAEQHPGVKIHFQTRITDVDVSRKELHVQNELSGELSRVPFGRLFATDGAFSAVRYRMQTSDRFQYRQFYLEHGYKELNMLPDAQGRHRMELNTLHIWPRKEFMMIALPNPDGTFTCTLFFAFKGPVSFEAVQTDEQIEAFFKEYFPDLIDLIPDYREQFRTNPTSSLVTVRCEPWNMGEDILLLGDAAHAIVPFYGQGMNAGFEDCRLFHEMLESTGWDGLFGRFGAFRKPDGDAISELALRNFIEMRDLTADPGFLLRKKIEKRFFEKHPDVWMPLYSMVTFSDIPYHKAWNEGLRQDKVMEHVMQMPDIENRWDSDEVEAALMHWNAEIK